MCAVCGCLVLSIPMKYAIDSGGNKSFEPMGFEYSKKNRKGALQACWDNDAMRVAGAVRLTEGVGRHDQCR